MTELWRPDAYRTSAAAEAAAFTALAAQADLTEPVPSCPDWTVADLVKHVGRIHRWVAAIVDRRLPSRPEKGEIDYRFPADPSDFPQWQAQCSAELAAALRAAAPDEPVWTWGPGGTVGWWLRRMLHETTVHRVDLELALRRVVPLDVPVAVDGVDEFLANLATAVAFAPDVAKLVGTGETILFRTLDTGDSWLVTLGPDGFAIGSAGQAEPDATVQGPAADLYLQVWGRPTTVPPTQSGTPELLALWTANSPI